MRCSREWYPKKNVRDNNYSLAYGSQMSDMDFDTTQRESESPVIGDEEAQSEASQYLVVIVTETNIETLGPPPRHCHCRL